HRGLEIGDIITKINDCEVRSATSWTNCLHYVKRKNGICFDPDIVRDLDETSTLKHLTNGYVECCDESKRGNVCFEFIDNDNGILELPSHVCLPARKMLNKSDYYCSKKELKCPNNLQCFVPLLNRTRLFKLEVMNKPVVIYMGLADDFLITLRVSSYIPKYFLRTPLVAETAKKCWNILLLFR
ncbi:hypothetical protein HHI36_007094, partial [Cryptolaemus montrouzieri]